MASLPWSSRRAYTASRDPRAGGSRGLVDRQDFGCRPKPRARRCPAPTATNGRTSSCGGGASMTTKRPGGPSFRSGADSGGTRRRPAMRPRARRPGPARRPEEAGERCREALQAIGERSRRATRPPRRRGQPSSTRREHGNSPSARRMSRRLVRQQRAEPVRPFDQRDHDAQRLLDAELPRFLGPPQPVEIEMPHRASGRAR